MTSLTITSGSNLKLRFFLASLNDDFSDPVCFKAQRAGGKKKISFLYLKKSIKAEG